MTLMSEARKVEYVAAVSVDENDIVIGTQPVLSRFLGQPLHNLAQHVQCVAGAYQKDDTDVSAH